MARWRPFVFYILIASAMIVPSLTGQSPTADQPIAKINGRTMTRAELDAKGATTLLEQRYDFYRTERETLIHLLDDELIAQEAHRRNLTTEKLLQQEVDAKVKNPTDAELRVFYEGAQTEQPFESVRAQLLTRVHQTRLKKARENFLTSLRKAAGIQILLPPPSVEVSPGNAEPRGAETAPVAFVEFADFECPFCREMQPQIERLLKNYNGKVALYFRDFPLSIHSHAEKSSEAARCAGQQGAFWPYHDLLFREGSSLEIPQLKDYGRMLRLDTARFNTCLDTGAEAAAVQKDVAEGTRIGINGTPAFFINGHFLSGVVPYETLVEVVEQQLTAPPPSKR